MSKSVEKGYRGCHYFAIDWLMRWRWQYSLWERICCKLEHHLWSEVLGTGGGDHCDEGGWNHYLVCDACQLMMHIKYVDDTYVSKAKEPA